MTRVRDAAVPFRSMRSTKIAPFFSIDTKHTNAVTMYARKKHTFAFKKNFIPLSAHTLLLGNTSVVLMKSSEHERLSGRMIDTIRSKSSLAIMDEEEDVIYEHTKSHDMTKKPFLLTDIGEGIHEVEVIKWHVKPGDIVKQFDQICEVQSDKASVDITSRYDGVIDELCGEIGGMIEVGSPLLFMRLEGEDGGHVKDGVADIMPPVSDLNAMYSSNPDAVIETEASRDMEPISNDEVGEKTFSSQNKKVLTTPAVRRLGMEYDIDLSRIIGTGKGGRILKSDILRELHEQGIMSHNGEEETPKSSAASNLPNKHTSIADEIIPIRGYNRIMVNAMESTLQVPHMVYTDEVEMSALKKCREDLKPLAESKGVKISYLPFMVKACSLAMLEYPLLNSSIDAENMTLTIHQRHDIGIAIDSPKGLVVPVLRDCQDMSVLDIATELNRFRDLVRLDIPFSLHTVLYCCGNCFYKIPRTSHC